MFDFMNEKQKAIAAAVVTFLTSLATSLLTALQAAGDGATLGDLSQSAWLTVIVAVLGSTGVVTGAVYAVPNRDNYAGYDFDLVDDLDGPSV